MIIVLSGKGREYQERENKVCNSFAKPYYSLSINREYNLNYEYQVHHHTDGTQLCIIARPNRSAFTIFEDNIRFVVFQIIQFALNGADNGCCSASTRFFESLQFFFGNRTAFHFLYPYPPASCIKLLLVMVRDGRWFQWYTYCFDTKEVGGTAIIDVFLWHPNRTP